MNPCGAFVSMVRFDYQAEMRVWGDDTGATVRVQWYPCAESALSLPFAHAFGSRVWDAHTIGAQVIGEDPLSVRFHSGAAVVAPAGQFFCGDERLWLKGASVLDRIPPTNVLTGLPCCCGPAPFVARGGGLGGGTGTPDTNYLLAEDGSRILQEDGSGILWR